MTRVGQDGGAAALDNDPDWIKTCRQRTIEGGTLNFVRNAEKSNESVAKTNGSTSAAKTVGGGTSAVKAVHNYAKFRTKRLAVEGLDSKIQLKWIGFSKLCSFWVHVADMLEKLRRICMAVNTHKAWGRLEGFVKQGTDTGHFNGSMLSHKPATGKAMDWPLMQDLVQQASSAALGREESVAGNEEDMVELMGCLSELREFADQGAKCEALGVRVMQDHRAATVGQGKIDAGKLNDEAVSSTTIPA